MNENARLPSVLLLLRLSVFLVMLMWTLDKFVNPDHAAKVFESFYLLKGFGHAIMYAIGAAEMALIIAFLLGLAKRWTYGAVLVLHAVSTLSSYKMYFSFDHLLFFAAWPMLAACWALYWLRDADTLASVSGARARSSHPR